MCQFPPKKTRNVQLCFLKKGKERKLIVAKKKSKKKIEQCKNDFEHSKIVRKGT